MQRMHMSFFAVVALLATLVMPVAAQEATPVSGTEEGPITLVASGLTNPRGVTWVGDGTLYVAQAGNGGQSLGTPTLPPPVGPVGGGPTASVVRIENGCPVVVAGNLPSTRTANAEVLGAEDLAILGDELYAAVDGGGEAHGNAAQPSGVYRILQDGTSELVADLSAWVRANPTQFIPPDFDPDAAGFSLVADEAAGALWVVNPNSGEIISVTPGGAITRVVDLSVDHPVPTGLAADPNGGIYIGNLTAAPYSDGQARVLHVAPDGTVTEVWRGLTTVTDVAVGPDGTLYAAEMSTGNIEEPPFAVPSSGKIVRQTGPDSMEEVASGLMFPISIAFGPDGGLFVSMPAFGADNGEGVIARIDVAAEAAPATPIAMAEAANTAQCPVAA
jgi:SMP-30/Gluconolactonase/LRE-like region